MECQSHKLTVEDPVTVEYITRFIATLKQVSWVCQQISPRVLFSTMMGLIVGTLVTPTIQSVKMYWIPYYFSFHTQILIPVEWIDLITRNLNQYQFWELNIEKKKEWPFKEISVFQRCSSKTPLLKFCIEIPDSFIYKTKHNWSGLDIMSSESICRYMIWPLV